MQLILDIFSGHPTGDPLLLCGSVPGVSNDEAPVSSVDASIHNCYRAQLRGTARKMESTPKIGQMVRIDGSSTKS